MLKNFFQILFPQNSERVARQKQAPLRVIMGNPPYSIGQKSANDNAQNQAYPKLDQRIADTYAKQSTAVFKQITLRCLHKSIQMEYRPIR
jgi:predicted helicase